MSETSIPTVELQVRDLTVPAEEGQLSRVRDFVTEVCEEAGFSSRETNNTKLAVDEACTNIIKHAYDDSDGEITITTRTSLGRIEITLADQGKFFDFAGVKDPDLDQYVETGKKGGLGVFLINRLMDGVEYHASGTGNELVMHKRSRAVAPSAQGTINWRGSLRYKFTVRATLGLFFIIAAIWGYIFSRQTAAIGEQHASEWMQERRVAQNVVNRSRDVLVSHEQYSIGQTDLTTYLSKIREGGEEIAYVNVVDRDGMLFSSTDIDRMFTQYTAPLGETLLRDAAAGTWTRFTFDGRWVRDIALAVNVAADDGDRVVTFGTVHLGVYEDVVDSSVRDPRLLTSLVMFVFFLVGVGLITTLVSMFVKPIQVLTDGVRAIGQGSFDGKISIEGPAEIGAIASVFNEITEKFKRAQESVLEQESLKKEIEVAKQIQQALLPKKHPAVSGYDIAPYYQAAKEVGGDYYDFVQVDEDTLGVVVADVSGKGVPGSLVMTMIRTALRMEARGNKNASDVMSKMNDFVTDDMKKGMFVTMFYVILDSKNRTISYASAGHNPMILYRAEHNETFFLNPKGFPVGISLPDESLFRRSISLEKIKLKKEDMLLIYTDGVTEAMNERREQYGEDRLIETIKEYGHLPPTEFINRLEQDIKAFTGGNPQNDDITVVAVKEKLAADDVLVGIRKKLIDMVDVGGLSVKEACAKMKVSPSTYYRYKKRMVEIGERGLRNKVLREDMDLKRINVEDRKALMEIVRQYPEYGAKRITPLLNEGRDEARHISEAMVYDELRRLSLNTKDLRIEYLRRNRLIDPEPVEADKVADSVPTDDAATPADPAGKKTSREMVEDFLSEVTSGDEPPKPVPDPSETRTPVDFDDLGIGDLDDAPVLPASLGADPLDDDFALSGGDDDLRIEVTEKDGVAVLRVDGHLDSVTSSAMEGRLQDSVERCSNIVVDLTDVSYISSGGWGIFVGEVQRLRENEGDIVLVGMTSEVYDVFDLLGFSDIFKSFPGVDGAREYFSRPAEERFEPAPVESSEPDDVVADDGTVDEVTEGFVTQWESLKIEAVTVGDTGDIAVLSLRGIIDTISAEYLRDAIDKVIRSKIAKIVVDLSAIEYVSSGGWGTFTERLRELRRAGGDIKLFGMDPDVYYVFTMLGFNIVLSSFDILVDAIEDFDRDGVERPSEHPEQEASSIPAAPPTDPPPPAGETPRGVDQEHEAQIDDEFGLDANRQAPVEWEPDVESAAEPPPISRGREPGSVFSSSFGDASVTDDVEHHVTWSDHDGVLLCRLSGALDGASVTQISEEVEQRLGSRPPIVVFNFADVFYASSVGWGTVAHFRQLVEEWGGRIALCELRQELYDVFSLLEFHSFIPVFVTEIDAVSALQSEAPAAPAGPVIDEEAVREVEDLADSTQQTVDHDTSPTVEDEIEESLSKLDDHAEPAAAEPDWPTIAKETFDIDAIVDAEGPVNEEIGTEPPVAETPARPVEADQDDFVDLDREDHEVDVDKAVTDDRVDEDKNLRTLGWDEYGTRLRKQNRGKAEKNSGDDD